MATAISLRHRRTQNWKQFFYEFSHFESTCFEVYLKLVSEQFTDSLKIIQLDHASAHTAG
ncbi:hypothetical protein [Leptothermofonsia sp. ETS-13]|uniref:hypothetical protein n=1 Tax=Leptothermofonsia sp. ETS-13 TaxID=3035696 RepID=UPI003BA0766B